MNVHDFQNKWRTVALTERSAATLREQQAEAARLDVAIAANMKELGYGG